MKWLLLLLVGVVLLVGCSSGDADDADDADRRPEVPRGAVASGAVDAPSSCEDIAPTDPDLLGTAEVVDRQLNLGMCHYDVERARYENPAAWPRYFRIWMSVGSPGKVLSYAEVEDVVAQDPAGAASHRGHEVTATEEIDAAGWTYGFVETSHSVESPGQYFDDEVARASVHLVTDDATLHCAGELFYPGVTLADARAGLPQLTDYCNSLRDALWNP